jgi:hypothetical protein
MGQETEDVVSVEDSLKKARINCRMRSCIRCSQYSRYVHAILALKSMLCLSLLLDGGE